MSEEKIDGIDYFVDLQPETDDFLGEALAGLALPQKSIPPKFFYDAAGSKIFDQICEAPEYYVTRTEIALMEDIQAELNALVAPGSIAVEYGCGSSLKIRALLSALPDPAEYLAIDISRTHLINTVKEIAADYPNIRVGAICADFSDALEWPEQASLENAPRLAFFPGSTIGNQTPEEAVQFLARVRHMVGDEGYLLIGVDLKKDVDILNRAYNDAAGYTANFNLNLLHRMKRELGAQLDVSNFAHDAFYNEAAGRIEMHLISQRDQSVELGGQSFSFKKGESIHTENSYKYSIADFEDLARQSGFEALKSWTDADNLFSIHYMRAV
ncbi:MAG: L-histidine N(alpha)-methyltransferase [Rhodospirillaceae bacterium]|jgi:dimethylhistidine N-methyltransferase|nr:L-histidine N(alpha)-methyltransferase [Rhodospirillaceae bacterium]MBT4590279.1 L-histidine N(alpha)-methyltransferase [Rhodospirillaceae bacterium]MBT5940703.1 L-histidine N(alpha)-methyltransferase [Rhodospirillaceae bacterium]MBT7265933.1 L-histidine N(alpha)-methyltransferase [Rhodospirillaceae bacterium]